MNTDKDSHIEKYSLVVTASETFPKASTPVQEVAEAFLRSMKAPLLRKHFIACFRSVLCCLISEFGPVPIGSITSDMVRRAWLKRNRRRSSQEYVLARIKEFFRWCQANGYLPPHLPTAADLVTLDDLDPSRRWSALLPKVICLLLMAGICCSELLGLQYEDTRLDPTAV